jgi:hypothetical protein
MTRANDCTKDWKTTRVAMEYLGADSGESVDKAQGVLIGAVSVLIDTHHLKQNDAFNYCARLFPDDFRIECIPYEWLGMDRAIRPDDLTKISSFPTLLNGLPKEEKEKSDDLRYDLMCRYINIISTMIGYADRAVEPEKKLFPFTKHGTQWLADFVVNDLAKEHVPGRSNWHGENPSQWAFRGAILVQDGRVSVHT